MADITMPQLGETVTEGTITRWAKQVGDKIDEDEVLFEVSTDKVDSEVPSPVAGYITEILVQEGETVDVGVKLAVIGDAPGATGDAGGGGAAEAAEEPAAQPADEPPGDGDLAGEGDTADGAEEQQAPEPESGDEPAEAASKAEQAGAPEQQASAQAAPASGDAPQQTPAQPAQSLPAPSQPESGGDGASKVLSPVVRRLISEHNLDPNTIKGTGAGGRITRADVLAVIDSQGGARQPSTDASAAAAPVEKETAPAAPQAPAPQPPAAAPAQAAPAQAAPAQAAPAQAAPAQAAPAQAAPAAPAAAAPAAPAAAKPAPAAAVAGRGDEVIPWTNIRKRTAEHMVRSKATSAHTLVVTEVDYAAVDKVRSAERARFKDEEGFGLTYLPFISRAVIDALHEFPNLNASVGDEELIVHRAINLGIAVDLGFDGLLAPVIKEADTKRLRAIAREIHDLAAKARSKRLGADDISGGTFTITNPGPYGTLLTAPIINQPQVAILSTDGVKKKPVVVTLPDGTDTIGIHPVGLLSLTFDHRANDGAYAAAFVAKVKELLETRDWAQEL